MLVNLKIICQFQAHPVHQNSVEIFWTEIYRGRLFLGSNLVLFNRTLVPYEISKRQKLTSTQKKNFLSFGLGHVIFLLIYFQFGSHIVEDFEVP
jgi:hypothetical protein